MITRFAPSPTGYLHLGHAWAAKQAFEFGGSCLLRIEDIDHTRCRPEYTQAIYEDLTWLGFEWPKPVRIQSQHYEQYSKAIENLHERGLVYRCFKTRKELPQGIYWGSDAQLTDSEIKEKINSGEKYAWRLNMRRAKQEFGEIKYQETGVNPGIETVFPKQYGDVILSRKDIGTSYHIACTHDDAAQRITHVVRGSDFIHLTGLQRILQTLMGWPEPTYHHHSLLLNTNGNKLAKRNKDTSIRELREKGFSPRDVLDMASAAPKG